jgi:hypothetical protein
VACPACNKRSGAATMLLCDRCDRGYHMQCIGIRRRRPPAGEWYCSTCLQQLLPLLATLAAAREGPWRSRLGQCTKSVRLTSVLLRRTSIILEHVGTATQQSSRQP